MSNTRVIATTLEQDIKKSQKYSLTESDIRKYLNDDVSIYLYQDLNKIRDIRQLFLESLNVVLLYPTISTTDGHWIAMFIDETGSILHYFDSYGFSPSQDIKHSNPLLISNRIIDLLTQFKLRGGQIIINKTRYQQPRPDNNTCGLYAILRLRMKGYTNDQFKNYLNYKSLTPDELVILLTHTAHSNK